MLCWLICLSCYHLLQFISLCVHRLPFHNRLLCCCTIFSCRHPGHQCNCLNCLCLLQGITVRNFWPTVLSVAPLAHRVVCLSVVYLSSVTFYIVAKRYVLAKSCLKEWIGNQGQKVHFLGLRHIFTSGFASTATETAVFAFNETTKIICHWCQMFCSICVINKSYKS